MQGKKLRHREGWALLGPITSLWQGGDQNPGLRAPGILPFKPPGLVEAPPPCFTLPLPADLSQLPPAGWPLIPAPPCLLPTGPLCSVLVGRFGCRVTVMLGGVLASLGMVASSFCYTLSQFYLTAGFITGDCHSISRISGHVLESARHK